MLRVLARRHIWILTTILALAATGIAAGFSSAPAPAAAAARLSAAVSVSLVREPLPSTCGQAQFTAATRIAPAPCVIHLGKGVITPVPRQHAAKCARRRFVSGHPLTVARCMPGIELVSDGERVATSSYTLRAPGTGSCAIDAGHYWDGVLSPGWFAQPVYAHGHELGCTNWQSMPVSE